MNTGNDTIYSLHSRFSCYVVLPNGNHDYVRCQTMDGIVSGEYRQETEGLYQLFVRDYMYQMEVSVPVLVDRSRANRIHMEVALSSFYSLDHLRSRQLCSRRPCESDHARHRDGRKRSHSLHLFRRFICQRRRSVQSGRFICVKPSLWDPSTLP